MAGVYHFAQRISVAKSLIFLADLGVVVAVAHIAARRHVDVLHVRLRKLIGKMLGVEIAENILNSGACVEIVVYRSSEFWSYGFDHCAYLLVLIVSYGFLPKTFLKKGFQTFQKFLITCIYVLFCILTDFFLLLNIVFGMKSVNFDFSIDRLQYVL
jgi:hypothetical protein